MQGALRPRARRPQLKRDSLGGATHFLGRALCLLLAAASRWLSQRCNAKLALRLHSAERLEVIHLTPD